jgi:hypothetical protein
VKEGGTDEKAQTKEGKAAESDHGSPRIFRVASVWICSRNWPYKSERRLKEGKKHTPAFDVLQCDLPDEYCSSLPFLEEGVWGEMNGSLD